MKLTRLADYAVRAVIHLASKQNKEKATISEIAKEQNIPQSFLAKVMQNLTRGGLVIAHRGKMGGFYLAKDAKEITIRTVVEVVEGPIILNRCLIKPGECERDVFCSAHTVWIEAQEALAEVLDRYSMEDLLKMQRKNLMK